jgi:SAM-dependent methyltransferase
VFAAHMASVTQLIARVVASEYDFSATRTLCDVGGGNGMMLRELLSKHAHLRGMLFEQAAVAASARESLTEAGLLDRCTFVPGNFFDAVPEGADPYLMKNIVHDWEDEPAIQILRNCRRAMRPGCRLLLVEVVIPPGNGPSIGKIWDMTMLVLVKGIERTAEEYRQLLGKADFALTRIIDLSASIHIIEAEPA